MLLGFRNEDTRFEIETNELEHWIPQHRSAIVSRHFEQAIDFCHKRGGHLSGKCLHPMTSSQTSRLGLVTDASFQLPQPVRLSPPVNAKSLRVSALNPTQASQATRVQA